MGNIKKFNEFNSINEGLVSWAKKTFKPRELDDLVKNIIKTIKSDFKISNVTLNPKRPPSIQHQASHYINGYLYEMGDDKIVVMESENNYSLILNDDWVGQYVSEYYIEDLYNFIDKKYKNKSEIEKTENRKKNVSDLRSKYNRYEPIKDEKEYDGMGNI